MKKNTKSKQKSSLLFKCHILKLSLTWKSLKAVLRTLQMFTIEQSK